MASNVMCIQRNLLVLLTMNFFALASAPTFLPFYDTEGHFNSFAETNKKVQ